MLVTTRYVEPLVAVAAAIHDVVLSRREIRKEPVGAFSAAMMVWLVIKTHPFVNTILLVARFMMQLLTDGMSTFDDIIWDVRIREAATTTVKLALHTTDTYTHEIRRRGMNRWVKPIATARRGALD